MSWIFKDGQEYICTHWWYDADNDNDYEVNAIWQFERGYDIPDSWHLIDVEIDVMYSRILANNHADEILSGCRNGGPIWCDIESQGPDEIGLKEVDYS